MDWHDLVRPGLVLLNWATIRAGQFPFHCQVDTRDTRTQTHTQYPIRVHRLTRLMSCRLHNFRFSSKRLSLQLVLIICLHWAVVSFQRRKGGQYNKTRGTRKNLLMHKENTKTWHNILWAAVEIHLKYSERHDKTNTIRGTDLERGLNLGSGSLVKKKKHV